MARAAAPSVKFSLEEEAVVVGCALGDPPSRRIVVASLKPDDFVDDKHRLLFTAAREMDRRGLAYSEDTVASLAGPREAWGGFDYLRQLVRDYGGPQPNLQFHILRLRATTLKANFHRDALPEIMRVIEDPKAEPAALAGILRRWGARADTYGGARGSDAPDVVLATATAMKARMDGKSDFVGFEEPAIDGILSRGLAPGDVSVLGGHPRRGKSTYAVALMRRRANVGKGTTYISCEATPAHICQMMISAELRLPYARVASAAALDPEERKRVGAYLRKIQVPGLFEIVYRPFSFKEDDALDDKGKRAWRGAGSRNRRNLEILESIIARSPNKLVVVDLFGYVVVEQEVALIDEAIMHTCDLAGRYGVHVMLVHHLKRAGDASRTGGRPTLDMLRGTGGFEQYCDEIFLCDRPKKRKRGAAAQASSDTFEILVEKQRDGEESHVIYDWAGAYRDVQDGRVAEYCKLEQADAIEDDKSARGL